jgi:hypothetical protein
VLRRRNEIKIEIIRYKRDKFRLGLSHKIKEWKYKYKSPFSICVEVGGIRTEISSL